MAQESEMRHYPSMVKSRNSIICVVDDDDSVRESLDGLLKSIGFSVATFDSAEAFLETGPLKTAACLILDVRMSGMSGLDLQRELTRLRHTIPIVFITAHADESLSALALRGGAIAVLAKPFDEADLLTGIESALGAA